MENRKIQIDGIDVNEIVEKCKNIIESYKK